MDYIYNVFMNFLKHKSLGGMDFQWRDRNPSGFINISSIVNQSLIGLESHESE